MATTSTLEATGSTWPFPDRMEWKAAARVALLDYAKAHPTFTAEQAWTDICAHIGEPASVSIKGYLFRDVLIKGNHLIEVGHAKAENARAKGRQIVMWKSKLSREEHEMVTAREALMDLVKKVNLRQLSVAQALDRAYALGSQAYVA